MTLHSLTRLRDVIRLVNQSTQTNQQKVFLHDNLKNSLLKRLLIWSPNICPSFKFNLRMFIIKLFWFIISSKNIIKIFNWAMLKWGIAYFNLTCCDRQCQKCECHEKLWLLPNDHTFVYIIMSLLWWFGCLGLGQIKPAAHYHHQHHFHEYHRDIASLNSVYCKQNWFHFAWLYLLEYSGQ